MKILNVKRSPLLLSLVFVFAQSVSAQSLLINEVDADQAGTDSAEFVELFDGGVGNTDLGGLVLVFYNGSDDASYESIDLDGHSTNASGYFVVCGDGLTTVNCDLDVAPNTNLIQNGEDAVALLLGDADNYPNDTPLPGDDGDIVDAIVYETGSDTNSALVALLNPGQAVVDEDDAGNSEGHSNQRCPNGAGGARNTDTYQQLAPSPGVENTCATTPPVVGGPYEIWEIQGAGQSSPFVTQRVLTQNNIVTALSSVGFFMQSSAPDGDINTSDGLFVFTGRGAPPVELGNLVDVTGNIEEFFGFTQMSNQPEIVVTNVGIVLPAPVEFDANTPSPDPVAPSCAIEYECYEGMLVSVASAIVTGPNQSFRSDPIAEVWIAVGQQRTFREPGIEYPGRPGLSVWDGNPEVFELDPDRLLGLPNQIIPAGSLISATGVIAYEFGDYELWPTELSWSPPQAIKPSVRERAADEFTVGSLNLYRLFDSVDDPADISVSGRTRNDNVVATSEYEIRRAKFVNYILNVIDAPDVLAVQEVESLTVLQALAADIAAADPGVTYTAYLIEGNDIGTIDVGFLVRDTVAVDAITQLGKDEILAFDLSLLHDRPPLLLEARSLNAGAGADYPFTVMVVHNRSLSGIDSDSRGERVRAKRLAQAQSIAEKVQAMQTEDPDIHLIILGDFNAFEFSDGYVDAMGQISGVLGPDQNLLSGPDLVEPNLVNQVLSLAPEQRYSHIYNGNAQALDHALTSSALEPYIAGLEFGRGNADSAEDLINEGTTPLASSDHDGLVLFVNKAAVNVSVDSDNDGVNDDVDMCPGTVIPEMPVQKLRPRRFALTDDNFIFDTKGWHGRAPRYVFTTEDTAGCSCAQIVEAGRSDSHRGSRHRYRPFGCTTRQMKSWITEQRQTASVTAPAPIGRRLVAPPPSESRARRPRRLLEDAPIRRRRRE